MGWTVWQVARDLSAARASATSIPSALGRGSASARETAITLREHAAAARDRTSGPTWQVLEALPGLGDDFDATARASRAVDLIAREGVQPLVSSGLSASTFAPRNGRIPVTQIAQASQPITDAGVGFRRARAELEPIRLEGLSREVRPDVEALMREVDEGVRTLDEAARAARVLPAMLGADGRRTFLLVFQNNAEPRSLGGMPGLMAPLRTDEGRVSIGAAVPASSFGDLDRPVLPLTAEERRIWDDQPGTWFQDAVFIPDFARASELMAARYEMESGTVVDGVVSVDPISISYLMEATGAVQVEGRRLTSDNFVDEILHRPYVRYRDDRRAEDAFFASVLEAVFDRVLGTQVRAPALVAALSRGAEEGRLMVHLFDESAQQELAGTRVAGGFPHGTGGPAQAGVYVNDATGSKMGYYLDYDARVSSVSCAGGVIGFRGQLRIHSTAPRDAARLPMTVTGPGTYGVERGDHLSVFDLVAPSGGEISEVVVNGVASRGTNRTYEGRPVVSIPILLRPGDVVTVTWRATSGTGHTAGVEFVSTPGVHHGGARVFVPAPCGEVETR